MIVELEPPILLVVGALLAVTQVERVVVGPSGVLIRSGINANGSVVVKCLRN
jgi:hypothetical protein